MLNIKPSFFFLNYNFCENVQLRLAVGTSGANILSKASTCGLSSTSAPLLTLSRSFKPSSYFDFVRFFNMLRFIFMSFKPEIGKKRSDFFINSKLNYNQFCVFFPVFYHLNLSPKANFFHINYFNSTGVLTINEPHVVFSVSSPYFDYHSSRLNLSFNFTYSYKNPYILNIFNNFFLHA